MEVPRARSKTAPPLAYRRVDRASPSRPSERPTLKTLPPVDEPSSGTCGTEVIELSASALDSVPDVSRRETAVAVVRWRGVACAVAGVLVATWLTTGGAAAVSARVTGVSDGLQPASRERHEAASQHTPLVLRAPLHEPKAPAGRCATAGASRVLATRARLAPGLDVNVLDGGFGVGFAASADEALGLRLDGASLRVADRVRVRSGAGVKHVAVDAARHDDDGIDVRIDADDARTVVPDGDPPAFRLAIAGGWIQLVSGAPPRGKVLWRMPGAARPTASAPADARASASVAASVPDLRAAARDDGGAVIALRRPPALWLGLVDAHLAAQGPLVALARPGAVLGMPAVAPFGGGGAVAWAERPAGDRELVVMVAAFGAGADGAREAPTLRRVGAGMSPSIARMPDGDLLLAYAVGTAGSHRVLVRRLGRDLEPRGEPVFVSPDEVNAGQPVAAVAWDGRAVVAFFGAERGRPASVLATPLACDTGL